MKLKDSTGKYVVVDKEGDNRYKLLSGIQGASKKECIDMAKEINKIRDLKKLTIKKLDLIAKNNPDLFIKHCAIEAIKDKRLDRRKREHRKWNY